MSFKKKSKSSTTQLTDLIHSHDRIHNRVSPEPNDGSFITKNPNDSFSSEGTVRYGEETDVDDI